MKTKTYLRYISCVLAVLLCVASIMPIAFADSTNHGNSESLLTGSNYSVSYSMNGKDVVEQHLVNQQHQLQEVTIACSMKFIKISKITKTDSWHKFLHSLEAR